MTSTAPTVEELKPCPFCGSDASMAGTEDTDIAFCPKCDATIVADIGAAAIAWNTRQGKE